VLAALTSMAGRSVLLLEKEFHPRYQIGESLEFSRSARRHRTRFRSAVSVSHDGQSYISIFPHKSYDQIVTKFNNPNHII
jgi:hypothetical protein